MTWRAQIETATGSTRGRGPWDFHFSSLGSKWWSLSGHLRIAGTALLFQISHEMMGRIPILRSLRSREKQAGKDVTLQDEHQHVVETRSPHTAPPRAARRPCDPPQPEAGEDVPSSSVYVGNLPGDARASELKRALGERGVAPLRLTWQGPQHRAFLHYPDPAEARRAVSCLRGLHLGANTLRVALARQQRARDLTGGHAAQLHPDCFPTI